MTLTDLHTNLPTACGLFPLVLLNNSRGRGDSHDPSQLTARKTSIILDIDLSRRIDIPTHIVIIIPLHLRVES